MSDIRDYKELLWARPAIRRLGPGDQGVLDEGREALTFEIGRLGRDALQERQPGSDPLRHRSRMRGVIRLNPRRRRAAALVEVNADENRFRLVVRHDGAILE